MTYLKLQTWDYGRKLHCKRHGVDELLHTRRNAPPNIEVAGQDEVHILFRSHAHNHIWKLYLRA